jgi:glucose-1-phosphate thymidylyltransferase
MKGILLAGGSGTRLRPLTTVVSKQLLPIYSKPLVYYPLSTLMLSGAQDILVIAAPRQVESFRFLLGDGSQWGCNFSFAEQLEPRGIAQALIIGDEFLAEEACCLALGDNIFHGASLGHSLQSHSSLDVATILATRTTSPQEYAVIELNSSGFPLSIQEKPHSPRSSLAVTGLYFYPRDAARLAREVPLSARGEYEITSLNEMYLRDGRLRVIQLPRGTAWFDAGTVEGLFSASSYVRAIEQRQDTLVGSPDEVSWRQGWIDDDDLCRIAQSQANSDYARYLLSLISPAAT